MSYNFKATDLQKLYGHKFSFGGHTFEIQPKAVFPARSGLEAYGIKLLHTPPAGSTTSATGTLHSFLKIFRQDIPERRDRTTFLIGLGLTKGHWAFQCVPYAWFPGTEINGVQVVGHLTKFLGMQFGGPAQDFSELKEKWDIFTADDRRAFASHLASAVDALENIGVVHGDLSPGNIMIGPGPNGRLACCLCDFDGFIHSKVQKLPRKFDRQDVRPLGTPGYQYPELMARISADTNNTDDRVFAETDRFSLAAIICELMVWGNDTSEKLGRGELLSEEALARRNISTIPNEIKGRFASGFALLEQALRASSCRDMPSPKDWLKLFGVVSVVQSAFKGHPRASFKRRGSADQPLQANFINKTSGDLADVHASLSSLKGIAFARAADGAGFRFRLSFNNTLPVLVRRGGGSIKVGDAQRKDFEVFAGDTVAVGDWEITFDDPKP